MGGYNSEKKREYDKKWYQENKDKRKTSNQLYYKKNKERLSKQQKEYRRKNLINYYKANAKTRNINFELDENYFNYLISQPCHYCGQEQSSGVDRIDSSKGYTKENCIPCCGMCNRMKNKYGYKEFIEKCKQIANNRKDNLI